MAGSVSCELEVNAPASLVWDLYKGLELAATLQEGLTDLIEKIDAVGDGSVGTVLDIKFKPGAVPFSYNKERFTKVDHENRVKETEVFEGGYCDLGFSKYLIRFEIVDKDEKCCITKATTQYELKEDADPKLASLVSVDQMMLVMNIAANKVINKNN
ncbi:norbelladine synthase-like [Apium graveolens]|uniref:norbelladine synthase-like n=1 Tax=Apium graveolens TaxID=4045 RepID=UPI003D7A7C6F